MFLSVRPRQQHYSFNDNNITKIAFVLGSFDDNIVRLLFGDDVATVVAPQSMFGDQDVNVAPSLDDDIVFNNNY